MNSDQPPANQGDPADQPPVDATPPPAAGNDPGPKIDLDQFLKIQRIVQSGGQAKHCIQGGEVLVNGQVETRRRRKLRAGDIVEFAGATWAVEFE